MINLLLIFLHYFINDCFNIWIITISKNINCINSKIIKHRIRQYTKKYLYKIIMYKNKKQGEHMQEILKTTILGLFFGTFGTTIGGIIGIK